MTVGSVSPTTVETTHAVSVTVSVALETISTISETVAAVAVTDVGADTVVASVTDVTTRVAGGGCAFGEVVCATASVAEAGQ